MTTQIDKAGSCLCGTIRWRALGPMRNIIACHCVQCRKTSGHFSAYSSLDHDEIVIEGDVTWYRSSAEAQRGFCATCGSVMFWQPEGEARVSVAAGSIEGASGLKIISHIFCGSKGDYYDIADGVPQRNED